MLSPFMILLPGNPETPRNLMIWLKIYLLHKTYHIKTSTDRNSGIIRSWISKTTMWTAEISTTTRKMLANAEDAGWKPLACPPSLRTFKGPISQNKETGYMHGRKGGGAESWVSLGEATDPKTRPFGVCWRNSTESLASPCSPWRWLELGKKEDTGG
jgi:hypothetical protein